MGNIKVTGRAASMPKGLLAGVTAGYLVLLTGLAILAKFVNMEKVDWDQSGYGIMLVLILSSGTAVAIASCKIKRQILKVSALTGCLYFICLVCTTVLFFGGQFEAVGVTAALVFGGSIATGLLQLRRGERRSNQKQRKIGRF